MCCLLYTSDYQIAAGMPYDDYEKIKPYIKEYALLEMNKEENGIMKEYMVNDRSTRESVDFRYFPGMRLVLTGDLDEFLPLREGSYPRIPDEKHNGIDYSKERAMVPRRIQYDFDKYIANSDYVNQHPEYANDTYAEFVEGFSVHGAAIYGFTESIMNQGYVAFTSRRKSPVDKVHYPYLPKMLVKVKDEKAKADMEKMMKQSALTYNSYAVSYTHLDVYKRQALTIMKRQASFRMPHIQEALSKDLSPCILKAM